MAYEKPLYVEKGMLRSTVFRELTKTATTVYFDFRLKCQPQKVKIPGKNKKEWIIKNNGELVYTYDEAERKGIPRNKFKRAIDNLIDHGFIDISKQGSGGKRGDVSLYAISDRWRKYGTPEFESATRQRDTRQGRGWSRYNTIRREKRREESLNRLLFMTRKRRRIVKGPTKNVGE
jgi:hypothetical protein